MKVRIEIQSKAPSVQWIITKYQITSENTVGIGCNRGGTTLSTRDRILVGVPME